MYSRESNTPKIATHSSLRSEGRARAAVLLLTINIIIIILRAFRIHCVWCVHRLVFSNQFSLLLLLLALSDGRVCVFFFVFVVYFPSISLSLISLSLTHSLSICPLLGLQCSWNGHFENWSHAQKSIKTCERETRRYKTTKTDEAELNDGGECAAAAAATNKWAYTTRKICQKLRLIKKFTVINRMKEGIWETKQKNNQKKETK